MIGGQAISATVITLNEEQSLPGLFERLEVTIAIPDPGSHYHVPLLLSPYSCVIYRGS